MTPLSTSLVLVVEDDPALREAWSDTLTQQGYQVRSAGDAFEALAQARIEPRPQLALLDLGLPPKPGDPTVGLELLRQLVLDIPGIKAIILTGQDEAAVSWRAIELGAFDFLLKPASRAQVLQAFKRAEMFLATEQQMALAGQARITLTAPISEGVKEFGEAAQERLVRGVLADSSFNVAQAARKLGVTREHLYYFMKKFGIERANS
jgi:two-component system, response regulator RegA